MLLLLVSLTLLFGLALLALMEAFRVSSLEQKGFRVMSKQPQLDSLNYDTVCSGYITYNKNYSELRTTCSGALF